MLHNVADLRVPEEQHVRVRQEQEEKRKKVVQGFLARGWEVVETVFDKNGMYHYPGHEEGKVMIERKEKTKAEDNKET